MPNREDYNAGAREERFRIRRWINRRIKQYEKDNCLAEAEALRFVLDAIKAHVRNVSKRAGGLGRK
jgi:hypothetical protein